MQSRTLQEEAAIMMSGISNMNASTYTNIVSNNVGSGKICVPVSPSMVAYSQFEHVQGVAVSDGQTGVNINKVEILNRLIDQLVTMKQTPPVSNISEDDSGMTESQVDVLINDCQSKIKDAIALAEANPYSLPGAPLPQTGIIFNINA